MEPELPGGPWSRSSDRDRRLGLWTLVLALAPSLLAVWWYPEFITQDGPAHVYNAHILKGLLQGDPVFRSAYTARWRPIPNWAGHLTLMGLQTILPARAADKTVISITLVGLAVAILWLRWCVVGWRGMPTAALLAVLCSLNVLWLLGFYGFLLGAALYPITLGVWWRQRASSGRAGALTVAGLLILGYFCHVVSLGLTLVGLVLLAWHPREGRGRRLLRTVLITLPLVPLGLLYRRIMSQGGAIRPTWEQLRNPFTLRSWLAQLGWVDPLTLGSKQAAPFIESWRSIHFGLAPVVWCGIGLFLLGIATVHGRRTGLDPSAPNRRVWGCLAALLLLLGVVAPDTLGAAHGNYLQQRIVLLGLISLVPALDLTGPYLTRRLGTAALVFAVVVQSAFVWDYANRSNRTIEAFLRVRPMIGVSKRVAVLYLKLKQPFRANPLYHADCLLGLDTHNIVWNNYETTLYYFPVQIKPGVPHPPPGSLEAVSIHDDATMSRVRAAEWKALLARYHDTIDMVVVWGGDSSSLDPITDEWFEPVGRDGPVRVLERRSEALHPSPGTSREFTAAPLVSSPS